MIRLGRPAVEKKKIWQRSQTTSVLGASGNRGDAGITSQNRQQTVLDNPIIRDILL
jgi:hypothetical protein